MASPGEKYTLCCNGEPEGDTVVAEYRRRDEPAGTELVWTDEGGSGVDWGTRLGRLVDRLLVACCCSYALLTEARNVEQCGDSV